MKGLLYKFVFEAPNFYWGAERVPFVARAVGRLVRKPPAKGLVERWTIAQRSFRPFFRRDLSLRIDDKALLSPFDVSK